MKITSVISKIKEVLDKELEVIQTLVLEKENKAIESIGTNRMREMEVNQLETTFNRITIISMNYRRKK